MAAPQPIPYQINSDVYFTRLEDLPFSCWLDSGRPYCHYGRYDILTALPATRIVTRGYESAVIDYRYGFNNGLRYRESSRQSSREDPFSLLAGTLATLPKTKDGSLPFHGGALGYFSYDLGRRYHGLEPHTETGTGFAQMNMGIYHWAVVQDHHLQAAWLVSLPSCQPELLNHIHTRLQAPAPGPPAPLAVDALTATSDRGEYLDRLRVIGDYILAGDCYQVNLSHCFRGNYRGSPYSAYQVLREVMASPFSAYLSMGDETILSLSPERFLQVRGRQVLTQPIKGTVRRHPDQQSDKQLAHYLSNSAKNRAENLMIVDLLRNDLGHNCIPGSIRVDGLFDLQSFPNVHHLVSHISGVLKADASSIDLLRDCFPGGSITGAPKRRAMEIIDELETQRRGVYCGSIGYINNNGDMDTNIAIRTVSCDGQTLYCQGGAGITADSDPEEEYQESLDKVKAILDTLVTIR